MNIGEYNIDIEIIASFLGALVGMLGAFMVLLFDKIQIKKETKKTNIRQYNMSRYMILSDIKNNFDILSLVSDDVIKYFIMTLNIYFISSIDSMDDNMKEMRDYLSGYIDEKEIQSIINLFDLNEHEVIEDSKENILIIKDILANANDKIVEHKNLINIFLQSIRANYSDYIREMTDIKLIYGINNLESRLEIITKEMKSEENLKTIIDIDFNFKNIKNKNFNIEKRLLAYEDNDIPLFFVEIYKYIILLLKVEKKYKNIAIEDILEVI